MCSILIRFIMEKEILNKAIKDLEESLLDLKRKLNVCLIKVQVSKIKKSINQIQEDLIYLIELKKDYDIINEKYSEEQLSDLIDKIYEDIDLSHEI